VATSLPPRGRKQLQSKAGATHKKNTTNSDEEEGGTEAEPEPEVVKKGPAKGKATGKGKKSKCVAYVIETSAY